MLSLPALALLLGAAAPLAAPVAAPLAPVAAPLAPVAAPLARLAAPLAAPSSLAARDAAAARLLATSSDARARFTPHGDLSVITHLSLRPRDADPVLAARAFLDDHGAALGVSSFDGSALVLRKGVLPGETGPVIFERLVRGLTVFGGHVTVGIGAEGEIHSATSGGTLPPVAAEFTVDEAHARRIAAQVPGAEVAWIRAGWSLEPTGLRPTWVAAVTVKATETTPYRSMRVVLDGATGRTGPAFPLLRTLNQGKLYRISPAKPFATTTPPAACPVTTDSKGNKKHANCAPAETVALLGLSGNGSLTGNSAAHQGRTTVYNCKGGTTFDTSSCTQTFHADGSGDFIPANLTDYGTTTTDPMSELQAYYFVDTHSRFMDSLDPSFAGLPLIPSFTNGYGPSSTGFGGNGPLDNAFFDPSNNMMVFGQGSSVDFAYDGEVAFHEMTHAACGAMGAQQGVGADTMSPIANTLGLFVDPLAVNEGNADTFSFMEAGVNDPELAEFDALDEISLLGQKIPVGPNGNIRNEGPDNFKTCQGDGTNANPGRSGEAHDDGEIWAEFTYEAFQGLKPVPIPAGATYSSAATPAMFRALQQFIALPNAQQTFSVYAGLFESQVRTQYGTAAGDYVKCLAQRRDLAGCDGQTINIYSGEKPFKNSYVNGAWEAFYYSKAEVYPNSPPAGFDGVPGSFQWKIHVPAGATALKVTVCDITPSLSILSAGGTGTLHLSYGKPVSYTTVGSGTQADWTYPAKGSWSVSYKDCANPITGASHAVVATLTSSGCTNCTSSSGDDKTLLKEGDWYLLAANTGGAASFASLVAEIQGGTAPTRPAPSHPACTLGTVVLPDGGTDAGTGADAGTDAGTGADAGTGNDGGTGSDAGANPCPDGYTLQDGQCVSTNYIHPRGCASGGAPLLALLGIAALLRRRRNSARG
jgi:hypothetical protein